MTQRSIMPAVDTDFGVKQSEACPAPCTPKEPKESYPEVSFRDEQYDRLVEMLDGEKPQTGDQITCPVKFRVTGTQDDTYGRRVTLCILSMGDAEISAGKDKPKSKPKEKAKPEAETDKY